MAAQLVHNKAQRPHPHILMTGLGGGPSDFFGSMKDAEIFLESRKKIEGYFGVAKKGLRDFFGYAKKVFTFWV